MAKILTDKELVEIIRRAVHDDEIDDADQYVKFLEDLGDVVAKHFGAERGNVGRDDCDGLGYTIGFRLDENVPADGGVYKDFDSDVSWENGEEI